MKHMPVSEKAIKLPEIIPGIPHYDVAVVGAGGGGCYTALFQKQRGRQVALFDRNQPLSETIGIAARVHSGLEYLGDKHTKLSCLISSCIMAIMWWDGKTDVEKTRMLRKMCQPGSTRFGVTQKTEYRVSEEDDEHNNFDFEYAKTSYDEVRSEYKIIFDMVKEHLGRNSKLTGDTLELLTANILFGRPSIQAQDENPEATRKKYDTESYRLSYFYDELGTEELRKYNRYRPERAQKDIRSKDPLAGILQTQELGLDIVDYLSALQQSLTHEKKNSEQTEMGKINILARSPVTKIEPLLIISFKSGETKIIKAGDEINGEKIRSVAWENNKFTLHFEKGASKEISNGSELYADHVVEKFENKFLIHYEQEQMFIARGAPKGNLPQKNELAGKKIILIKKDPQTEKYKVFLEGGIILEPGKTVNGITIKHISYQAHKSEYIIDYTATYTVSCDQAVNAAWARGIDLAKKDITGDRPPIEARPQRMARIAAYGIDLPEPIFILDPKGENAMMLSRDGKHSVLLYIPGKGFAHPHDEKGYSDSTRENWKKRASELIPALMEIHEEDMTFIDEQVIIEKGTGRHVRKPYPPREGMPGYSEIFPLKAIYAPMEGILLDGMLQKRKELKEAGLPDAPLPPELLPGEGDKYLETALGILKRVLNGEHNMVKAAGLDTETFQDAKLRRESFAYARLKTKFPREILAKSKVEDEFPNNKAGKIRARRDQRSSGLG